MKKHEHMVLASDVKGFKHFFFSFNTNRIVQLTSEGNFSSEMVLLVKSNVVLSKLYLWAINVERWRAFPWNSSLLSVAGSGKEHFSLRMNGLHFHPVLEYFKEKKTRQLPTEMNFFLFTLSFPLPPTRLKTIIRERK